MKKNSGQSLIEVLASIAVLVIIILSLLVITTISVRNSSFSRNQTLATKYAQEAIEKIRLYRDKNTWKNFVDNCESFSLEINQPSTFTIIRDCYLPNNQSLNCNENQNNCEVKVTVSWTDNKGTHKSELTTILTNWK